MIIHDIEDNFDTRAVQSFHHVPEFIQNPQGIFSGTVSLMGRKKETGL